MEKLMNVRIDSSTKRNDKKLIVIKHHIVDHRCPIRLQIDSIRNLTHIIENYMLN